jgi:hypothetical protein
VIDKLDVRIPAQTRFHPEFQRLYSGLRLDARRDPFHATRHYTAVADLRPYGEDAVLHMGCKWGKVANHKLELLDTGLMSYSRLVNEIERIFQMDAKSTGVMRLDLAADNPGVPVNWFQSRIKANHKQYIANFGSAEFVEMGKGGIQTLYFGRRPNLIRIYDKVAEYKAQFQKLVRGLHAGEPRLNFEDTFGVSESAVITRVERQMGGKIPEILSTVGKLKSLDSFRPFDKLKIIAGGTSEPDPKDYGFMDYCTGMYLRGKAEREGMHATIKFIDRNSNRNTRKVLQKFKHFLPGEQPGGMTDLDFLNEIFRRSVSRQLGA